MYRSWFFLGRPDVHFGELEAAWGSPAMRQEAASWAVTKTMLFLLSRLQFLSHGDDTAPWFSATLSALSNHSDRPRLWSSCVVPGLAGWKLLSSFSFHPTLLSRSAFCPSHTHSFYTLSQTFLQGSHLHHVLRPPLLSVHCSGIIFSLECH